MNEAHPRLEVIYDGDCPFCASYVEYCRLREAFPGAVLTNAREVPDRVAAYRAQGMDINVGMIVTYGDAVYFGDQAMNMLARIARAGTVLQAILRFLFRWPVLAKLAYAVLRGGRNLTLRLLGRRLID